jgi:serine/threonine protein kinase
VLLQPGTVLKDTYEIIRLIGEGGAGAVYEGRHVQLGHPVAIKVLFAQLARIPQIRERFIEEGRIQANLKHPNLVGVTDILEQGGTVAIVMEFIEGPSLDDFIQQSEGPISEIMAAGIILRLLSSLGLTHEHSIIHRDIKPGNIMLARSGDGVVPKITDFGIAKVVDESGGRTITGTKMGTLYYMAPEQFRDARSVDGRADIYALGVTFFEMVTQRLPFETDNDFSLMRAHLEVDPPSPKTFRPELSMAICEVILKAMEKDPDKRYDTCADMAAALVAIPGFESLKNYLTVPSVNEEQLMASSGQPAGRRSRVGGARSPGLDLDGLAGPALSKRPHGPTRPQSRLLDEVQKPPSQLPWFSIFLGVFAAALVAAVVVVVMSPDGEGSDQNGSGPDAGSQQDAPIAANDEDVSEETSPEEDPVESEVAVRVPVVLTAVECAELADSIDGAALLTDAAPADLGERLESDAAACRQLLVAAANDNPYTLLWAQTQSDVLQIARYTLLARAEATVQDACRHVLLGQRAYERALERLREALEGGSLLEVDVPQTRMEAQQLFQWQSEFQTVYHTCILF